MEEARTRSPRVTLRYFDGCPNWRATYDLVRDVLSEQGLTDVEPRLERVETAEDAERLRFIDSPTVLIDGLDPFVGPIATGFGLTCRVYVTPDGLAGLPTREQLREAFRQPQGVRGPTVRQDEARG